MKKVAIITGGGSGMGYAFAKALGSQYTVLICGRTASKLEKAVLELKDLGIEIEALAGDIRDKAFITSLFKRGQELGKIAVVINSAGVSPSMCDSEAIMTINALGTVNVTEASLEVAGEGFCLVNIASNAAYIMPAELMPTDHYKDCFESVDLFMQEMMKAVKVVPEDSQRAVSYSISKSFVVWYSKTHAVWFGAKGARILSVSPGSFETPMGDLEREGASMTVEMAAIKRFGETEEIANLIEFLVSSKASYLTGADFLCDGGTTAGMHSVGLLTGHNQA